MTSVRKSCAPKFTELNDLASSKNGGKIIFATDDWFAAAENLINPEPPVWKDGFTDFGKWMDGWETRRKRTPGHDWCIIKLGLPGTIRGVELDTRYFTGNYTPRISVQAAKISTKEEEQLDTPTRDPNMGKKATEEELMKIKSYRSDTWETIVPMSNLGPGYADSSRSFFTVPPIKKRFTHIRLNYFPDGGVSRLRIYGIAVPELARIPSYNLNLFKRVPSFSINENEREERIFDEGELVDLMAMENGGICIGYSDAHYGHPRNIIGAGRAPNMGDGWETARRLDRPAVLATTNDESDVLEIPGFEWCAFKLGIRGTAEMIEVDTNHFKGNYADSILIEGALTPPDWNEVLDDLSWETILTAQKLEGHQRHFYKGRILKHKEIDVVRVIIKPDGGISRVRLFGKKAKDLVDEDGDNPTPMDQIRKMSLREDAAQAAQLNV